MACHNESAKYIKIGKLHSPSNLKSRAECYEKRYANLKTVKISDRSDEDSEIKSSEFYERHPSKGHKGFTNNSSDLMMYFLYLDRIDELEMNLPFTSDEESDEESDEDGEKEVNTIPLPLSFDLEEGLIFRNEKTEIDDDVYIISDSSSDEGSSISQRPVSRLSLEVDEKCNESIADGDSDYYYCEDENNKKVIYGLIQGISPGTVLKNRRECSNKLLHVPCKSRIHAGKKAACSIVLSSQELVVDSGVEFIYKSKARIDKSCITAENSLIGCNKALQNNFLKLIPIRVIRGYQLGNAYAPKRGYRFDGLYDVSSILDGTNKNGYQYCKASLVKCDSQDLPWAKHKATHGQQVLNNEMNDIECESVSSYNRASPASRCLAMEHVLGTRSKMYPIVRLVRLSPTFIQQAINKNCEKTKKKSGRPKKVVSPKHSRSSDKSKNTMTKQSNAKLNRSAVEKKNNLTPPARQPSPTKRKRASSILSQEEGNMKHNYAPSEGNRSCNSRMSNASRSSFW